VTNIVVFTLFTRYTDRREILCDGTYRFRTQSLPF